ncbi:MAG: formate/nitrite transporter family protein [Clostridiaceae bacterium]
MEGKMLKPYEICDEAIHTGIKKANYTLIQAILLGVLAGAFIALGGFAAAMASHGIENAGVAKLVAGAIFPVGLMLVLICGGDLFTGNCLMSVALVEKKITLKGMMKNWVLIYLGNFLGALLIAFLIFNTGLLSTNSNLLGGYAVKVAANKANLTFVQALCGGILCNILVAIAVWGAYAAKDIVGKIFIIWFPVMAFIIGSFEHCVANMYYFSIGFMAKNNPSFIENSHLSADKLAGLNLQNVIFNNMIPATIGNIIGGSVFVGLAYWGIYKYNSSSKTSNKSTAA